MAQISLTLYNESDVNKPQSLVFYNTDIAWTVVKNLSHGEHPPLPYTTDLGIAATNLSGSYETPKVDAPMKETNGYNAIFNASDEMVMQAIEDTQPGQTTIKNSAYTDGIIVKIYNSDNLFLVPRKLNYNSSLIYTFWDKLYAAVSKDIKQGEIITNEMKETLNPSKLELAGVASAEIVLYGAGTDESPFQFKLRNVISR